MTRAAGDPLIIATRGSALALWQAEHVKARLIAAQPGLQVSLLVLKTTGDKILDRPLSEVGGKGLFVKEIEQALLDDAAHVAVHSMKDVPADLADGLRMAAISAREDPRDALVSRGGQGLAELARRALHSEADAACVAAERGFTGRLGGGCQTPLAAHARQVGGGELHLVALIGRPDGTEILKGERRGPSSRAAEMGADLAEELLGRGGARILRDLGALG